LNIFNPIRPGLAGIARPVVATVGRANIASNAGRQTRFDARSRRRYGDWSALDVPAALLWFEEAEIEDAATDPDNPYA
jgi:hypothetical protein